MGIVLLPLCFLFHCLGGSSGLFLTTNVCYGDLGCFGTGSPFFSTHRPINLVPAAPNVIQTQFLLYTRNNPTMDKAENMGSINGSLLTSDFYDGTKKTKIVIHGFTDDTRKQWVQTMITQLLKKEDMNVIAVDWGHGAGIPYTQATANTRLVGAIVAKFLKSLLSSKATTLDKVHLIGHSLGAHTAGYVGERVRHIPRITGLDPAGPYFDGTDPAVSLDPSDADFIDVIHTDGSSITELGLGAVSPMGHVDFFPNGGHHQPGCTSGLWTKGVGAIWNEITLGLNAAKGAVACSHLRSIDFFTESINSPCIFKSYPCSGEQDFQKGSCLHCPHGDCSHMGYDADKFMGRGSLYLDTQAATPYCSYHYQVNITETTNLDGIYTIVLRGTKGSTNAQALMSETTVVPKNIIYSHLVVTPHDIGALTSVTLEYDETSNLLTKWLYPDTLNMLSLSAFCGETGNFTRFCARGKAVTSHTTVNIPTTC